MIQILILYYHKQMKNNPNKNITYDMISEMIKNKPTNQEKKLTKEELEKQEELFRDFCDF